VRTTTTTPIARAGVPHPRQQLHELASRRRSQLSRRRRRAASVRAAAASDDGGGGGAFDGDAARALKEAAALDDLIDMLLAASAASQQQMAQLVAENVFAFDTKFWLRVATRADAAPDEPARERLRLVADGVVALLGAAMKQTESRLSESAGVLQDVLSAAADAQGQWYLPLGEAQVAAVRAAMDRAAGRGLLDEALLSNAFAWIRKCNEDGLDTMAQLIQKVLQLYAARALSPSPGAGEDGADGRGDEAEARRRRQDGAPPPPQEQSYLPPSGRDQSAARVLDEVIAAEEHEWEGIIERSATLSASPSSSPSAYGGGPLAEAAFSDALQRKMEATVLGLSSGSYAQRVQAEYLKEIEGRARSVFRRLAGAA